tara:strand:+ start:10168 stop:12393 length:2226 start_codon:yes stop_codon:yes gene_type:complete
MPPRLVKEFTETLAKIAWTGNTQHEFIQKINESTFYIFNTAETNWFPLVQEPQIKIAKETLYENILHIYDTNHDFGDSSRTQNKHTPHHITEFAFFLFNGYLNTDNADIKIEEDIIEALVEKSLIQPGEASAARQYPVIFYYSLHYNTYYKIIFRETYQGNNHIKQFINWLNFMLYNAPDQNQPPKYKFNITDNYVKSELKKLSKDDMTIDFQNIPNISKAKDSDTIESLSSAMLPHKNYIFSKDFDGNNSFLAIRNNTASSKIFITPSQIIDSNTHASSLSNLTWNNNNNSYEYINEERIFPYFNNAFNGNRKYFKFDPRKTFASLVKDVRVEFKFNNSRDRERKLKSLIIKVRHYSADEECRIILSLKNNPKISRATDSDEESPFNIINTGVYDDRYNMITYLINRGTKGTQGKYICYLIEDKKAKKAYLKIENVFKQTLASPGVADISDFISQIYETDTIDELVTKMETDQNIIYNEVVKWQAICFLFTIKFSGDALMAQTPETHVRQPPAFRPPRNVILFQGDHSSVFISALKNTLLENDKINIWGPGNLGGAFFLKTAFHEYSSYTSRTATTGGAGFGSAVSDSFNGLELSKKIILDEDGRFKLVHYIPNDELPANLKRKRSDISLPSIPNPEQESPPSHLRTPVRTMPGLPGAKKTPGTSFRNRKRPKLEFGEKRGKTKGWWVELKKDKKCEMGVKFVRVKSFKNYKYGVHVDPEYFEKMTGASFWDLPLYRCGK